MLLSSLISTHFHYKSASLSKKETLASGAVITTTELVGEKIVFSGDNGYRAYPEETDELEEEK